LAKIEVDTSELLTVTEAAATIGMHRATLYRWVESGKVNAIRLGSSLYLLRIEVEKIKEERK